MGMIEILWPGSIGDKAPRGTRQDGVEPVRNASWPQQASKADDGYRCARPVLRDPGAFIGHLDDVEIG
jgi:hypothetical protein